MSRLPQEFSEYADKPVEVDDLNPHDWAALSILGEECPHCGSNTIMAMVRKDDINRVDINNGEYEFLICHDCMTSWKGNILKH